MDFFTKTVVERTQRGMRQSVEQDTYIGHAYRRTDGLAGALIADKEYPPRVAYSLLNKILEEFTLRVPNSMRTPPVAFPLLREYLDKYQDPHQADSLLKVQAELDETKIVLHKTIESVLQRGERLDNLIEKSDQLSGQSKMFYKTAKKTNSCCVVM
jgi:synaptobrevin family protein YKT6